MLLERIDGLEEEMATAKTRLNEIKMKEFPDTLATLGTAEYKTENGGFKAEVGNFVAGSLPKRDKEPQAHQAAIDWLSENGADPMIKTQIYLDFGKQEKEQADRVIRSLKKAGFVPSVQMGVHPQSLLAWVRQRMAAGEAVPFEKLGLEAGRTTKFIIKKDKGEHA